jgi:hypothetical protein
MPPRFTCSPAYVKDYSRDACECKYDRVIDYEAVRPLRSQTSMISGLKKHDIVQWSSRLQRDFRTPMTRSARCCQPDWSRHGLTVDTRVLIVNDYYARKLAPYTRERCSRGSGIAAGRAVVQLPEIPRCSRLVAASTRVQHYTAGIHA